MITNTLSDYNLWLAGLSIVVSVAGAYVALVLSRYIGDVEDGIRIGWLVLASLVFSCCAIWGMHFLGMLAYAPGEPVSYDIGLTTLSLLAPIPTTLVALLAVARRPTSTGAWLGGGLLMGVGVVAMHYTGMAAMRAAVEIHYDPLLLGTSIAIAIVMSTAALRMAVRRRGPVRFAGALMMGGAIAGMHYTGMAAMEFQPTAAEIDYFDGAVMRETLQVGVAVAFGTAVMGSLVSIIGKQMGEVIRDRDNTMGRM